MKKFTVFALLCSFIFSLAFAGINNKTNPGKVYLFAYATEKNKGQNGLHFAWSTNKINWQAIGPEYSFLKCDYGRWGSQKRMLQPFLFQDDKGLYHCIWSVNEQDGVFAHAASKDLVNWMRQSYLPVMKSSANTDAPKGNIQRIEAINNNGKYTVSWLSEDGSSYTTSTGDFKTFAKTVKGDTSKNYRVKINLSGEIAEGTVTEVSWEIVNNLKKSMEAAKFRAEKNGATAKTDAAMFSNLKPLTAHVTINTSETKNISNILTGVFFEDINYAADGGLYAELIQNRGFEYDLSDKEGKDRNWNHQTAWEGNFTLDSVGGIHANNAHFAILKNSSIINTGFDGIAVKAGDKYDFSFFAKGAECTVKLVDASGAVLAQAKVKPDKIWKKYNAVLKPSKTVADAKMEVSTRGETAIDMVSLFPQKTFKGHKNGLRADLAQTVADIHPKFVRFPGGCVAHGDGLGNIYRWKNTVGALEARKPMRNLWGYHQSMGLGYFEYFQYCEDINAEPVPVLAAGVPCQNSGVGGSGQQFGIPMEHMDEYVQDVLDLIEYANGGANTKWGKVRAEAGHPKPFNLKYIGIGNEDLITDVFEERYTMIVDAVRKKYPDIIVIGTVGPFYEGTDYVEGWALADKLKLPVVDEHYYNSPGWFINNGDFYDSYSRDKSKVYLGEYASWGNTMYNALAEALYLTGVERNGDVVSMASYAPMLAKEKHTQWNPDLIYFNNTEVKPTVNYYIQQLYGQHAGDVYLQSAVKLSDNATEVNKRFGISATTDKATGDLIIKIANVLPVTVIPELDLQGYKTTGTAEYIVFAENPESKTGKPVSTKLNASEALKKELPPYSFTVIRFKNK